MARTIASPMAAERRTTAISSAPSGMMSREISLPTGVKSASGSSSSTAFHSPKGMIPSGCQGG